MRTSMTIPPKLEQWLDQRNYLTIGHGPRGWYVEAGELTAQDPSLERALEDLTDQLPESRTAKKTRAKKAPKGLTVHQALGKWDPVEQAEKAKARKKKKKSGRR